MCCHEPRSCATISVRCGTLHVSLALPSRFASPQVFIHYCIRTFDGQWVGDNLMLHVAMYEAPPGSVVVVQSGDVSFAAIGGNVARIAKERGIAGLVLDGVVRDIAEIRALGFPVFARGIVPFPGTKTRRGALNERVVCGDVTVDAGDVVVADEEGIVVVPTSRCQEFFRAALVRQHKENTEDYEEWKLNHRARLQDAYYSHIEQ
ncbi:hypothetical protein DYB25_005561 [Aphanomyces astaci]|uniref:Dimethylmenaquinone methyltransferase n=1 Tax=Aphanomyces astaci TaxID=112090 RepID=A0A397ACM2_APHAT|nr:hypothetical protein DYB25_005561 [Aphanomyces astaci]RHZ16916.1 hypothetical protein DYB26_003923 [Aphanomyces astaci]